MRTAPSRPASTLGTRLGRALAGLLRGLWHLVRFALVLWATLAIHFSNLPWPWARLALAAAFAAFGVWALWITHRRRAPWAFAVLYVAVLAWWSTILPSHDREWQPDVAVMPRAIVDGDRVRITGVRHFDYRSRHDFTVRYVEREVSLAHLTGVDLFVSFWMQGPVGHTFVAFVFDNAPPIDISIETRPTVGQGYDPLASMFKQFELIYVVGDERDLVRVRTNHRDEEVFLYRVKMTPESARRLFLVYLERINELAERPEWYHLLSNSCTINIIRYANAAGRTGRLDVRHVLNGLIAGYLYNTGRLDTTLPFDELQRRSNITATARGAGNTEDFPQRIRASLPGAPSP
jgi:hypothetical protein